jgi:hypothetical protein
MTVARSSCVARESGVASAFSMIELRARAETVSTSVTELRHALSDSL